MIESGLDTRYAVRYDSPARRLSLTMALTKRTRGYLPHWEAEGGSYSVTFRLGDSLPANVLAKLTRQRETIQVLLLCTARRFRRIGCM